MKAAKKKIIAYLLITVMMIGLCPKWTKEVTVKAATTSVSLANLGQLGSMSAGSKTKSGSWWMMKMGNRKAFCMNLGYTCHSGDVYRDSTATYNSGDSGKKGRKAYIGYWYAETMNESRKAYVMAQALFWAVEEGDTSESKLKAVISKVKSNTGYFGSQSADQLYKQIFGKSGTFSVNVAEWKYSGSGSHRQELLVITSGTKIEPKCVSVNDFYRQRIKIQKKDEDGNPMMGAKFTIKSENIDELYSYKINGSTSDADEDIADFSIKTETGSDGWINLRLTYRLQTNDYFFLSAEELKGMDSDAKKAIKAEWDEQGYKYAADLSQDGANMLMERELVNQFHALRNTYKITETDSGNSNIAINPEYKNGKTVQLDEGKSWTRGLGAVEKKEWDEVIEHPYELEILDNYKKVALSITKKDGYSSDEKEHGDAKLDGAVFGIYEDRGCTKKATFYKKNGKTTTENIFEIKNRQFETPYLRCGQSYYLKEIKAPQGYKLSTDVREIILDGGKYPNDVEYVSTKKNLDVANDPIRGRVALQKFISDGQTGQIHPEVGAVFQVYLASNGGYDACDDYERDTLTIDEKGYACSKELYFGNYVIHQVSSGNMDTEKVDDIKNVLIEKPDEIETKTFSMNNNLFKAYLRIVKKDGNTEKDVLKAGTTYQIYKVEGDRETLVTQEYSNGNRKEVVDKFVTDETGQIMTYQALKSGMYRIYETDAATGYHILTPYIEVEINSQADNYKTETDKDGNTYSTVELTYTNEETYGKLSLYKTGEQLVDFKDGKFVYEEKQLNGVKFEIYADADIETQDNQKSNWFNKDDLVATITTGKGASFESACGGITGYEVDENGIVTVNLPLGKYRVVETETKYGYVLPEKHWNVEFNWKNKEDAYVLNATEATDDQGVLNVLNERAKAAIQLQKTDAGSQKGVQGAVFGLYTRDAIYNAAGEKIVDAGTRLDSLVTDKLGNAATSLDLPLMSEGYKKEEESATGSAATIQILAGNSGDYFLKEEMVSGGYYLDSREIPLHLEYQDMKTPVIQKTLQETNQQTVVEIDKKSATGGEEIPGCQLVITDKEGKEIISWTSGEKSTIVTNPFLEQMGYQNVTATMDEKGNLTVNGLFHDTEYTLTEKRPADGFVTADSISFQLRENMDLEGRKTTVAAVKNKAGEFINHRDHIVTMVDEKTKLQFKKKNKAGNLLGGAKISVYDSKGKKVTSFTTKKGKTTKLEGVLTAGETYTFKETKAPDGYDLAKPVSYTIKDTKNWQKVSMTDKKIGLIKTKTPDNFHEGSHDTTSPKTGYMQLLLTLFGLVTASGGTSIFSWRRYYKR